MSFWDINQFVAEDEKIEFSFKHEAFHMDFLDATREGTIPVGQVINTSIWLVNTLCDYLELGGTFTFI